MTATEEATQAEVAHELTAFDRCDSCGAQAYVRATMPAGSELLFCAHHAAKHREKLTSLGATWHDETARLQASNERGI
jgi:hypothetical protein